MSYFNAAAATYDTDFSNTPIGKLQRDQVHEHLLQLKLNFKELNILELGAGTGVDALFFASRGAQLLATDTSEKMVEILSEKFKKYSNVATMQLQAQNIDKLGAVSAFNYVFSNFGALNCLAPQELKSMLQYLEQNLPPKSKITLVLLGKFCWWEWLYFVLKGQFKNANRRSSKEAVQANVAGQEVPTYYYSPSQIMQFVSASKRLKLSPIGWAIPPSYLGPLMDRNMLLFDVCKLVEKISKHIPFLAYSSDHYCITLET